MLALLIIVYILFVVSGLYKIPHLWGINFLFYQSFWIKAAFILIGGLIFVPRVNEAFSGSASKIHGHIMAIYRRFSPGLLKSALVFGLPAATLVFIFYHFRVIPLYHDSNLAIYFMTRDVSPLEYITGIIYGGNKSLLYLFYGSARYFFRNIFDVPAHAMLVIVSIASGLVYVFLIYRIVRSLSLGDRWNIFAFVLLFTQAITFYYFGYANFYGIVPIAVLLYVWASLLYLRERIPVYIPIIFGLLSLCIHLGTSFIILSTGYLIVHRFIRRSSIFFGIYSAMSPGRTVIIFLALIAGFFLFLNSGLLKISYLEKAIVPLFSRPELGYGWNLFSTGYAIHLLNVILLLSPVGVMVCVSYFIRINKNECEREIVTFFFWMTLGGAAIIMLVSPQTLYAWDIYAWASIGYVLLGVLLFWSASSQMKYSNYIMNVASVHSVMYFAAWIALNNNAYACVNNFIESVPTTFKNQVAVCSEVIQYDIRNVENHTLLLDILEEKSKSHEDYLQIIRNYEQMGDEAGKQRVYGKWKKTILGKIGTEPDNPYVYYQLYLNWKPDEVYDKNNRHTFEKYFRKPIELDPDNPTYLVHYASYLNKMGDYWAAIDILRQADSLYTHREISAFQSHYTRADILALLAINSYAVRDYVTALDAFDKMTSAGGGSNTDNVGDAYEIAALSCARLGNEKRALALAKQHQENLSTGISEIKNVAARGKDRTIGALLGFIKERKFDTANNIMEHCLKENDDPEFLFLQNVLYLEMQNRAGLLKGSSRLMEHKNFHPFIFLIAAFAAAGNGHEEEAIRFLELCEGTMHRVQRATWIDFLVHSRLHEWLDFITGGRAISKSLMEEFEDVERAITNAMPETYKKELKAAQDALNSFSRKDYAHFLAFIGGHSTAQNGIVRKFMDVELSLGSTIYNHAQKFIVQGNLDSLYYYGNGLSGAAPELFQGYFLLASYHKLRREYFAANLNYDKVIELMPSSDLISSPEESIWRIQGMKIDTVNGDRR